MEQLMTLSVETVNQDSATKCLAALKFELAKEKAAREKAQAEAKTLAWAVGDLKKTVDGFVAQIHILEEKVKHMDNKVLDGLTKIHAKELSFKRTTKANEYYKRQNAQLTKKVEGKLLSPLSPRSLYFT
jgi:hypothetical protein